MTTPRAHADLATLYFSDAEMMCWRWEKGEDGYYWWYLPNPSFIPGRIYHVGKIAPTEPPQIMCELAGVKFPMPAQQPPEVESWYHQVNSANPEMPYTFKWVGSHFDRIVLQNLMVHLNEESAVQHGKALLAANKQAIEKAKKKTK